MRLVPPNEPVTEDAVTSIRHHHIVEAYTGTAPAQGAAVLHMLYPRTDARTHCSPDRLVSALHLRGLHQVADMVKNEEHYLMFRDPAMVWKALHEIRNDSLAIGVHLFYRGQSGEAAKTTLDLDAYRAA